MTYILPDDLENSAEPFAVEPDEEYQIRIVDVKFGTNKNNFPYMLPRFEIVGEPLSKEFTHYMGLPCSEMSEKQKAKSSYQLKVFCQCFQLPTSGALEAEEMVGETGYAILGRKDDEEFGEQNYIKKLLVR